VRTLRSPSIVTRLCLCFAALLAPEVASASTSTSTPGKLSSADLVERTLPNYYVKGWGHATVKCGSYTDRSWVFWQTYAVAVVGDRWVMSASRRSLCKPSMKLARRVLSHFPNHLGATFDRPTQEIVATATPAAAGRPRALGYDAGQRGLSCYELPSSYEAGYEQERAGESVQVSAEAAEAVAWTRAVGVTASYVVCLTGAHESGAGSLSGSNWFAFGPQANDCALGYTIKEDRPDGETGEMTAPPIGEASIWGDYNEVPCPAGP
jgi:hypothetical protein